MYFLDYEPQSSNFYHPMTPKDKQRNDINFQAEEKKHDRIILF